MRIDAYECWTEHVPLSRPYTIAYETVDAVELSFVRIASGPHVGLGSASPIEEVTGESFAACRAARAAARDGVLGGRGTAGMPAGAPAAVAAVDMALHDLRARAAGKPLVELFGRAHTSLPTSITIGIKPSSEEFLAEAREYLGRGFTILKVKIGLDLEEDLRRLHLLRELCGPGTGLCIDANQGFRAADLPRLFRALDELDIAFMEQPLPPERDEELAGLDEAQRARLALDESLLSAADARRHAAARRAGIYNIKLMKCGGPSGALEIAQVADRHGADLMWGCSDESRLSIAAALHTAFACPRTRHLDLDGHLDLARDPARGGFELADGELRLAGGPGLGIELERHS